MKRSPSFEPASISINGKRNRSSKSGDSTEQMVPKKASKNKFEKKSFSENKNETKMFVKKKKKGKGKSVTEGKHTAK